jgi:hypothetical protein
MRPRRRLRSSPAVVPSKLRRPRPPPAAAAARAVTPESAAMPPAVAVRFDPNEYDAVILAVPAPLGPEDLSRASLVWRFVFRRGADLREMTHYESTELDRVAAMLAQIDAFQGPVASSGGPFADLPVRDGALPDSVIANLLKGARGLILRLEDLSSPALAEIRNDPRFTFWQPGGDGLTRVEITDPPAFGAVALASLPGVAPVALVRRGAEPSEATRVGSLMIAARDAYSGSASPASHKRDLPGSYGRPRLARQLGVEPEAISAIGLVVELDPESGRIPEPWPADMILMTVADLRAPLMRDVLDNADAYLVAYGQTTPITGKPPETDTVPEAARATRGQRAAIADAEGPILALPRGDGAINATLGVLSPHVLFLEHDGATVRLASNGWKGGRRVISLASAIEMNDPLGTRERLSELFAQPNVAVFLNHNPGSVPANDMGLAIYDAIFDGSRRFVRVSDGTEVEMPFHPAFAPRESRTRNSFIRCNTLRDGGL